MLQRISSLETRHRRTITASLRFAFGGGRTFLARQHVPYPFHITRPHRLGAARPDAAALILQSASGGLYRGDRLVSDISAEAGACAQVTSQAATVAHAAIGSETEVETRLRVANGAFLAVTTDPYVLFPEANLTAQTLVTLEPGATALIAEGFAIHDPAGGDQIFERLTARCRILDSDGKLLVDECAAIRGADFAGKGSPLGRYRAMGAVMLLGRDTACANPSQLLAGVSQDVLAGASVLPNKAGWCARVLAPEGGRLSRALDLIRGNAIATVLGSDMVVRGR